jgi:hypothetical protein
MRWMTWRAMYARPYKEVSEAMLAAERSGDPQVNYLPALSQPSQPSSQLSQPRQGQANITRHVTSSTRIFNPRFLSNMSFYDLASSIC